MPPAGVIMESNPEGTNAEFVWGFVMGSILGVIMLLFVWHGGVSRKRKAGKNIHTHAHTHTNKKKN